MASSALTMLSMTIGFFFILMGTMKLTPAVNEEVHRELRKMFIRDAKVFPLSTLTGWKPNAHMYRKVVGGLEVVCGIMLAILPGPVKQISNVVLLLLMLVSVYTTLAKGEKMDRATPSIVFGLLLGCRLFIYYQVRNREEKDAKEIAKLKAELEMEDDEIEELEESEKKTQ
ncbi:transmembrane protein 35A isoform X1 [Lingula anatina]|uniref:Novel acetylcholine receptor chaperone n=1 Tax=Lingula anatina TaxID=7574 RepID=A0A1S3IQR4_LINAN|nr:transmembrane protein 35A isoform X2 [Lingula anatina]XP_013400409.1 transmembrane protein 35A isoform X1 [Lingula anatina]|eukprot:XP_013400408.1 transmembrane protein 35A isoform X2 [Lingula anatina]